ncbi:hypothetical protein L917_13019 [Phytophthora nicotianae]|uniref:RxLR effector protein n=1 Tax=Phytophthora nicotianae TaxID=4792 RepID=W2KU12_PHYNI|nr:hypothetical protein L917_13019 [Phytophthora nicotianae]
MGIAADGNEATIKKYNDIAAFARANAKLSDDEVAMMTKFVKESKDNEAHAMSSILGFAQKKGDKTTEKATVPVAKEIAEAVVQNPKSWSRLRKFAKIALGATVSRFAIYGAYKLLSGQSPQSVTPTTTTTD